MGTAVSTRQTVGVQWIAGIETESVSDSGSSNVVLAVTLLLVVAGIALSAVTVWFWRNSRPDPDALGPLLVMSERKFFEVGPIEQRRRLDRARPGPDSEPSGSTNEPDLVRANDVAGREFEETDDSDLLAEGFVESEFVEFEFDEFDEDPVESTDEPPSDGPPSPAPIDPLLGR